MDTLFQDIRYAVRGLLKARGFTVVAALTLALGIGATATIFSCVNALLLRPFPYRDPARLVALREDNVRRGWRGNEVSYPNFADWRAQARALEGAGAYGGRAYNVATGEEPQYVQGAGVSASMFRVLGVAPVLGRDFREEEDKPGAERVVLLSDKLWRTQFDGSADVLGRTTLLNDLPYTIIGVMPRGFEFPGTAQLWTPLQLDPSKQRGNHSYEAIGRLAAGATIPQLQAQLDGISKQLEQLYPESNAGWSASAVTLHEHEMSDVRPVLLIMMGATVFVLLIACANIANLLLARAATRQKEIAIRSALGAGRGAIVRQLLTESVLLAILGAALGVLVAEWGLDWIKANIPISLPFWMHFDIDGVVLAFIAAVAVTTGILFGLAPAVQASRPDLQETLRESGRGNSASRSRQRVRSALVVAQVALSLVLLIGATLMIRSFLGMQGVQPGFEPRNVLAMRLFLGGPGYDSLYQRRDFFERALARVRTVPGVEAVAAVNNIPLGGSNNSSSCVVEGQPATLGDEPNAAWRSTTPEYLSVMRIPLRRGRMFTEREMHDSARVAVVNETMVRRFWPTDDPIGKRFKFGTANDTSNAWISVIGVVADVKQRRLSSPEENQFYLPYTQAAWRGMAMVVRTAGAPEKSAAAVREAIRGVDANLPAYGVMPLTEIVERSYWQPRLYGLLFGSFAVIAVVLAAVGVYGVIAYAVAQRTHEIGVRMALGAQSRDVLGLVVRHGLVLAAIGVAIGVVGAFGVTRLLRSMLFGVTSTDPVTFVGIPLMLAAVATLASWLPARRAARVDPMIALRNE